MCACASHGGRTLIIDDSRCVLADVNAWTDDMTMCVKTRFPSVSVSIHHTNQSLSGFQVLFDLHEPPYSNTGGICMFLVVLVVLALFWCIVLSDGIFPLHSE